MTIFTRSSNTLSPELFLVELNSMSRANLNDGAGNRLPWRIHSGDSFADALKRLFLGK